MKVAKTWTFYTPGNVKVGNGMNHSSFVGQIDSGLAWSILLLIMIFVIAVVKILWTHETQFSESTTN